MMTGVIMQLALAAAAMGSNPYPNLQVVLDAGHGGLNPGVVWQMGDTILVERKITCQITTVVDSILETRRISVTWTTDRSCNHFTTSGALVTGDSLGLDERVRHIKNVSRRRSVKTLVVSVHVDSAWSNRLEGGYVIIPAKWGTPLLAINLANEFDRHELDQKFCKNMPTTIVVIGMCKIPRVRILRKAPVEEMILAEVASIGNPADRVRLMSEVGIRFYGELLARAIITTLEQYAKR